MQVSYHRKLIEKTNHFTLKINRISNFSINDSQLDNRYYRFEFFSPQKDKEEKQQAYF